MTRKEAIRQTHQETTLLELGFTREEAEALRRISMTLHRWFEHECNGNIQRDGDDGEGKPYWCYSGCGPNPAERRYRIADRETGARKRLARIISARNDRETEAFHCLAPVSAYIQTDPRGASLYIIRPGDVPDGKDVNAYYPRGICIY
jgi:hypothetical protein